MFRMAVTAQSAKKRPLLVSLMSISFWFGAGLTALFALLLLLSETLREQYANSLGWWGWGILLFGMLTIYLTATGIGLWRIKKWGMVLSAPIPIGLVLIGFISTVRFLTSGFPTDWATGLILAVFFIVGGLGWISELGRFWRQVNG